MWCKTKKGGLKKLLPADGVIVARSPCGGIGTPRFESNWRERYARHIGPPILWNTFGGAALCSLARLRGEGPIRKPERQRSGTLHTPRLVERPPHPARKSAPTSPRKRGEVLAF